MNRMSFRRAIGHGALAGAVAGWMAAATAAGPSTPVSAAIATDLSFTNTQLYEKADGSFVMRFWPNADGTYSGQSIEKGADGTMTTHLFSGHWAMEAGKYCRHQDNPKPQVFCEKAPPTQFGRTETAANGVLRVTLEHGRPDPVPVPPPQ